MIRWINRALVARCTDMCNCWPHIKNAFILTLQSETRGASSTSWGLCRDVMYSPNKPVGQNMINMFMKEACKKLKLKCTGHGFHALSISTVINEVANAKETLAFSRHTSLAAQRPCHRSGHKTEMTKFKALGLVKDPRFERRVVLLRTVTTVPTSTVCYQKSLPYLYRHIERKTDSMSAACQGFACLSYLS